MYLKGSKLVIDKESQSSNWDNQELDAESVVVTIVGGLELVVHQEQSEVWSSDEENLHTCVIYGYKRRK